jgi:ferredoxin
MKVIVDLDRCEGHARCAELAPEVFALEADGYSRAILEQPDAALRAKVETAVRLCPRQALLLIENQVVDQPATEPAR